MLVSLGVTEAHNLLKCRCLIHVDVAHRIEIAEQQNRVSLYAAFPKRRQTLPDRPYINQVLRSTSYDVGSPTCASLYSTMVTYVTACSTL